MTKYQDLTDFLKNSNGTAEIDQVSAVLYDTKTQLNMVKKLISQPCFDSLDEATKKERHPKLKANVTKTLEALASNPLFIQN